jgi:hypothetical protein
MHIFCIFFILFLLSETIDFIGDPELCCSEHIVFPGFLEFIHNESIVVVGINAF